VSFVKQPNPIQLSIHYDPIYVRRGADKSLAFPILLFAAQQKEFFLDGLKKLEQRSHKCVELRGGGEYVNTFFQSRSLLFSL
jgi:hypothetical protein